MNKYAILGAGPSGLVTALFLRKPHLILEKDSHPGGHTSSFIDNGFTFDQGPHIMFSKNTAVLDFMVRSLGKNIHKCRRNNKVYFKGKLIKWPFENNLSEIDHKDNFNCLYNYLVNPYKKRYPHPTNLRQWLLHHFGKGICESYLFPYNEKVWNLKVEDLSMVWADRIPKPPRKDIIKSSLGINTEGYLHQLYYHYPLRGGYQAISASWARKVNIKYDYSVKKITKTDKNTFLVSNGQETQEFKRIISTIPLPEIVKIISNPLPDKVRQAVKNLIINPMIVVSLGIRGADKNLYTAVYFPEKDFLVNRISFPKTFSSYNAPAGKFSIQAEITCKKNSSLLKKSDDFISTHVIEGLLKRGIIASQKSVVYRNVLRVPYAYVVYDRDYEKNVKIVRSWFPSFGIDLVGRFSYFEYVNVDGVVERAIDYLAKTHRKSVDLKFF